MDRVLMIHDLIKKMGLEKVVKIEIPSIHFVIEKKFKNNDHQFDEKIAEFDRLFKETFSKINEGLNANPSFSPPDSLCEFEERLEKFLDSSYRKYFGLALCLDLDERQTLAKNPSYTALIDTAIKLEKKMQKGPCPVNTRDEPYKFLKMALEKGYPFTDREQNYLGIFVDISNLTMPSMNQIAVQAAAQVLWYLEKEKIGTIEMMQQRLLDTKCKIFHLIHLKRFSISKKDNGSDSVTIRRWISQVFPKPKQSRKGRPLKGGAAAQDFSNLVTIPNVYVQKNSVSQVNYQRLHFVITCLTKLLQLYGWSEEKISGSEIIQYYREPLVFFPKQFVRDWVKEAFVKNSSIFDR